jgi:hypothetical protein
MALDDSRVGDKAGYSNHFRLPAVFLPSDFSAITKVSKRPRANRDHSESNLDHYFALISVACLLSHRKCSEIPLSYFPNFGVIEPERTKLAAQKKIMKPAAPTYHAANGLSSSP